VVRPFLSWWGTILWFAVVIGAIATDNVVWIDLFIVQCSQGLFLFLD